MKKIFATLMSAVMATFVLSLIGCSDDSGDANPAGEPTLRGAWKEEGCNMGFAIDGDNFIEYMNVSTGMKAFAGTIVNNPDLSAQHGLIVVRITDVGMSEQYGAAVGKYTVARWKTFEGNTVGQTNAKDAQRHPLFYSTEADVLLLTEDSPELSHFCCQVCNRM